MTGALYDLYNLRPAYGDAIPLRPRHGREMHHLRVWYKAHHQAKCAVQQWLQLYAIWIV